MSSGVDMVLTLERHSRRPDSRKRPSAQRTPSVRLHRACESVAAAAGTRALRQAGATVADIESLERKDAALPDEPPILHG